MTDRNRQQFAVDARTPRPTYFEGGRWPTPLEAERPAVSRSAPRREPRGSDWSEGNLGELRD